MTSILAILREVTPDRHNRAVQGLRDGTLSITLVKQSDSEIRALVKNGDGLEYRVIINDAGTICSCPDALFTAVPVSMRLRSAFSAFSAMKGIITFTSSGTLARFSVAPPK